MIGILSWTLIFLKILSVKPIFWDLKFVRPYYFKKKFEKQSNRGTQAIFRGGYTEVIILRGGHLSCHFLRKAPRTWQSDFNDQNKNNCKGTMFRLPRQAAEFSGIQISYLGTLNILSLLRFDLSRFEPYSALNCIDYGRNRNHVGWQRKLG